MNAVPDNGWDAVAKFDRAIEQAVLKANGIEP